MIALAEMILSVSDEELRQLETVDQASAESAERLRAARSNLIDHRGVLVPELINEHVLQEKDCHVMLVTFDGHNEV